MLLSGVIKFLAIVSKLACTSTSNFVSPTSACINVQVRRLFTRMYETYVYIVEMVNLGPARGPKRADTGRAGPENPGPRAFTGRNGPNDFFVSDSFVHCPQGAG